MERTLKRSQRTCDYWVIDERCLHKFDLVSSFRHKLNWTWFSLESPHPPLFFSLLTYFPFISDIPFHFLCSIMNRILVLQIIILCYVSFLFTMCKFSSQLQPRTQLTESKNMWCFLKSIPMTSLWRSILWGPGLCYFRSSLNRCQALSDPDPGKLFPPFNTGVVRRLHIYAFRSLSRLQ